jgi:hypothetical protein
MPKTCAEQGAPSNRFLLLHSERNKGLESELKKGSLVVMPWAELNNGPLVFLLPTAGTLIVMSLMYSCSNLRTLKQIWTLENSHGPRLHRVETKMRTLVLP